MNFFRRVVWWLLLWVGAAHAQQFPVDCRVLLSPPYSGVLSDYAQSATRLRVQLTLRDLSQPSLQVSLRVRLLGPGLVMGNPPDFIQTRPITLYPGVPVTVSGLDLAEHFAPLNWNIEGLYDPQNPLPPGRYEWEVVATELFRERQVSNVGRAFWNWSSNLPPQLNGPLGDQAPSAGLLFSWRSRSFLPLNRVWYRLFLYELDEDDDPQFVALSGAPPFRVIETGQTSYFYGPGEVLLTPGKRYAWRVQATDWQGETYFELDGWSEAGSFRLTGPPCLSPQPTAYVQPPSTVELIWEAVPEVQRYEVQVRGKSGETIWTTEEPRLILLQQEPGEAYEYRVQSVCGVGRVSTWTAWQSYTIPAMEEEESWMSDPDLVYLAEPEEAPDVPDPIVSAQEDLSRILNAPFEFLIVPADTAQGEGKSPRFVSSQTETCVGCEDTAHGRSDTAHGRSDTAHGRSDTAHGLIPVVSVPTDHARAGTPTVLPVLSEATTIEQLEAIVKPLKPQCAGVVSDFTCGTAEEIPVYTGEIIPVRAGDQVVMNTMVITIVEIDGQGNGMGKVKIPMFGKAAFGVKLVNLKVAEGGCVVGGYAEASSDVPLLVLDEKLRKNLQAIAIASELVAEVGKTYVGAIVEKINDLRDGLDKIRAWVKSYRGGKTDAGKAKAFQDFTRQASKAILENKAVPDSLKSALQAAQAKSQEAWAFYQSGKPCEVSGGGGGQRYQTFPVADCAEYATAVEAEMLVLEQIHKSFNCNCSIGDCYIIESIFTKVKDTNTLPEPTMRIGTNDFPLLRTIAENSGPSFTSGIKADKNCFHVKIDKKFTSGTSLLDLTKHQIITAQNQILIKDHLDQSGIEITLLPSSKGSIDDLVKYLGFGKEQRQSENIDIEEYRVRAFLRMLRDGEGTIGEAGYETLFGGESFIRDYGKDWSDHPNIKIKRGKLKSSAAGAYQVMYYTWTDETMTSYRKKYAINDFSPESQDLFGVVLLKYKRPSGWELLKSGKIKSALEIYSYEWASLPPPRYGQPVNVLEKCLKLFDKFLLEEIAGKTTLYLKKGFLKNFN